MSAPTIETGNILKKMQDFEAQAAHWTEVRDRSTGAARRVAVTALTLIERKLKWLRGRVLGPKPPSAHTHTGRKATKAVNRQKLVQARG